MSVALLKSSPETAVPASQAQAGQFPTLSEMGIARFSEISHYTLRQEGESKDVLKVHYNRAKGSLLPSSRKYKFGRSLKTVVADGGSSRLQDTYEISPYLLRAVSELDKLIARKQEAGGRKETLLAEMEVFEQQTSERLAVLRRQIEVL